MALEVYSGPTEVAREYGVTRDAVYQWMRKGGWPIPKGQPLVKATVDAYITGFIRRYGKARQKPPATVPPAPSPALPAALPVPVMPPPDPVTATLEDLERFIRQAPNSDIAEKLSKQVRALKVVREIQDRDGQRINAVKARAEVRAVLHYFQVAAMGIPRTVSGSLEGLLAAEIEAVLTGRLTELFGELKRGLLRAIGDAVAPVPVAGAVGRDGGGADDAGEADAEPVGGEVPDPEPAAVIAAGQVG